MSNHETLISLMQQAHRVSTETLKLPLPRRMDLPVAREYMHEMLGNQLIVMDGLIEQDLTTGAIAQILTEERDYSSWYRERGITREAIAQMVLCRRFQYEQGRVFTYRTSLCQRLEDMDIGAKVPMSFIFPPFPVFYMEFGPAEERGDLGYQVYSRGDFNLLEGAYLSFHSESDPWILSPGGRETLGIDPQKPLRCLEIVLTASPLDAPERQRMVLYDNALFLSMYWTDDDASIEEVLGRHLKLYTRNPEVNDLMVSSLEENLRRITKALLYLRNDNRHQEHQTAASDLERRLADINNPTKQRKAEKKLDRVYDRVVIGPNRPYRPLSEAISAIEHRTGVKPHIRRAHWSSRWAGRGKTELRPVKIDAVLVNASALSDEDAQLLRKDYDVK